MSVVQDFYLFDDQIYRTRFGDTHPIRLRTREEIPRYVEKTTIPRWDRKTYTDNFLLEHYSEDDSQKLPFKYDDKYFYFKTEEDRTMFLLRFA